MDTYRIVLSEDALAELKRIRQYIEIDLKEPQTAKNVLIQLQKSVKSLSIFPERNPVISDQYFSFRKIRKYPVGNHVIFYQVFKKSNQVFILHILNSRREWNRILGK